VSDEYSRLLEGAVFVEGRVACLRDQSGRRGRIAKGLDPAKLATAPATCGLSNHAPQYARQHVGAAIGCPAAEV
jgi:hypothetical protein